MNALAPDVLHGHGAKGGLIARLAGTGLGLRGNRPARLYSPHGGSLHYPADSIAGSLYFRAERFLERRSDGLIFVSDYERRTYEAKIGTPLTTSHLVYNGVHDDEFAPVALVPGAADFLFVGTMRDLKGPDVFIDAIAEATARLGRPVSAVMVGDGNGKKGYQDKIVAMGLVDQITMRPAMTAREAFALGRVMCVPSRAEAMPYIVLEALAAGKALIASRVGGIPEILGSNCEALVPPGEPAALAGAMERALDEPGWTERARPDRQAFRSRFGVGAMAEHVLGIYKTCRFGTRQGAAPATTSSVS